MKSENWGEDWSRWLIAYDKVTNEWGLWQPDHVGDGATIPWKTFRTFAEAHAAYLDAVTCDAVTPFLFYTEQRCNRARGHEGAHRFWSKDSRTPLWVNPK